MSLASPAFFGYFRKEITAVDFNNVSHLLQAIFVILGVVIFFMGFNAGNKIG